MKKINKASWVSNESYQPKYESSSDARVFLSFPHMIVIEES